MNLPPTVNAKNIVFFLLLAVVTFLFAYILKPFFMAIFWAALLAGIFLPLFRRLNARKKRPNLHAAIVLAVIILVLIIPSGIIISLLINESLEIYNSINSGSSQWLDKIKGILSSLNSISYIAQLPINEDFIADKSLETLKSITNYIFINLSALTQNTIMFLVQFAVMLYTLFYFIRDGESFVKNIARYLPVEGSSIKIFINRFLITAKATLKFTLVIGGIQGILGGLIFYIVGIERALIWGILMVGLSIVPAVGAAIIWAPAGVILLVTGHIWQGITVLIFGSLVISMVDNLLRPVLLGKDIEMPPLVIFLSTLGGIAVFGFSGFVLGPIIASFFIAAWDLFLSMRNKQEETSAGS